MAKILVVDDYEDNLYIASLVLARDNHDIITASSAEEAITKANAENPDVILLDIQMPGTNGFEACKSLKSAPQTSNIPIVFLTARFKDSESLTKGLQLGAEDYIIKPFSTPELRARVKVMVRLKSQMEQLATSNKKLEQLNGELQKKNDELVETHKALEELATTDGLTGLRNRRYFTERLEEEFMRTQRDSQNISLVMLDIDFFKKVNDQHGHQCGDSVLVQFSQILKVNLRQHDIVARYGGEEFIIAIIGQDSNASVATAERIRLDVEKSTFTHEDIQLNLTCSAGVGTYPDVCKDNPDLDALVQEVDAALYAAKHGGRNQVINAPVESNIFPSEQAKT